MRKQKQKSCFEIINIIRVEDLKLSLTELNGNVSFQLILETNCVDA